MGRPHHLHITYYIDILELPSYPTTEYRHLEDRVISTLEKDLENEGVECTQKSCHFY